MTIITALSKLCSGRSLNTTHPAEHVAAPHTLPTASSDSIATAASRPSQSVSLPETPTGPSIEKNAHVVWLHKNGVAGKLPSEYKDSALTFARLNKDWKTTFWTDKPQKLKNQLGNDVPKNLEIQSIDPLIEKYRTQYPLVADYVHGVKAHVPASAKDLISYMALDQKPGLFFDLDTKWSKPVPSPLKVASAVTPAFGLENSIILFDKRTQEKFMHDTLRDGEQVLAENINRNVSPAGEVTLKLPESATLGSKDLINRAGYYPFQRKAMYQMPQVENPVDASQLLGCTAPDTKKHWQWESMSINSLTVPPRNPNESSTASDNIDAA